MPEATAAVLPTVVAVLVDTFTEAVVALVTADAFVTCGATGKVGFAEPGAAAGFTFATFAWVVTVVVATFAFFAFLVEATVVAEANDAIAGYASLHFNNVHWQRHLGERT